MTLYYEAINRMPLADAVCFLSSLGDAAAARMSYPPVPPDSLGPACNNGSIDVFTSLERWH